MNDALLELYLDRDGEESLESDKEFRAYFSHTKGKDTVKYYIPSNAIKNKDQLGCWVKRKSDWVSSGKEYFRGFIMGTIIGLVIAYLALT